MGNDVEPYTPPPTQHDYESNAGSNFPDTKLTVPELRLAEPGDQVWIPFPNFTRVDGNHPNEGQAFALFNQLLTNIDQAGGRYVADTYLPSEDGGQERRFMITEKREGPSKNQVPTRVAPGLRSRDMNPEGRRVTGSVIIDTQKQGVQGKTHYVILEDR